MLPVHPCYVHHYIHCYMHCHTSHSQQHHSKGPALIGTHQSRSLRIPKPCPMLSTLPTSLPAGKTGASSPACPSAAALPLPGPVPARPPPTLLPPHPPHSTRPHCHPTPQTCSAHPLPLACGAWAGPPLLEQQRLPHACACCASASTRPACPTARWCSAHPCRSQTAQCSCAAACSWAPAVTQHEVEKECF